LPSIKDTVGVMFSDNISKDVEMIPLSNETVTRKINEMFQWTEYQLIQRASKSRFVSLQLDESTDVQGLCHLLVFIRFIWNNGPHRDMLFFESIIPSILISIKKDLDWVKCVVLSTGGTRIMCGKNSSVVQGWTGSTNRPGLNSFTSPTKVKLFYIHITIEKMSLEDTKSSLLFIN